VASKNDDVQLADFIESVFLNEQVKQKTYTFYVSGKDMGFLICQKWNLMKFN